MHLSKLLTILFLLVFSTHLYGQQPALRQYSVDDGLPSSEIYHIIQDSKGYIWLASNMGVSRFDGKSFKNFDVQDGLPENTVFEIYEDETGKIWFVSFPFQLSYYENNRIKPYKFNYLLKNIAEHGLVPLKKCLRADKEGNVFFSFMNDGILYKINKIGLIQKLIQIKNQQLPSTVVKEVGGQLLSTQSGVRSNWDLSLNIQTSKLNTTATINMSKSKYSGGYYVINQTQKGDLLFAQNELLSIIHEKGDYDFINFNDRVLWLSIDKDNFIWVGKEFSGVEKYNIEKINEGPLEHYLSGMSVTSVLFDNEDGVWFSTIGSGVFYLSSKAFTSFSQADGLSGKNIKAISLFRGKAYVGTDDNCFLDVVDRGKISAIKNFGHKQNKIKNLTSFKDKILWIGTEKHLHSYDGRDFKVIVNNHKVLLNTKSQSYYSFSIKDIYPINKEEVMLAQMRSLAIIRKGNVVYDSYYDDNISLRIESIERETDSTFLLGTFSGLWRLKGTKFQFLGEKNELLSQRIIDIVVFPHSNNYVLATKGSGLIVKLNDSIFQVNQSMGLSSNSITSLFLDGNDLWVATNNGLNLVPISQLKNKLPHILIFTEKQGLISNEINQISGYKNLIYIATTEGLTIFDKSKYKPLKYPPPIYIQRVNVMKRDTVNVNNIELRHNQNFITISYGGINFRDAGNLLYKYRLIGLSNNWITTKNLQVEYAFLPPGNYRFEVIAVNLEGLISSHPATLNFIIFPPFWKTWWFITIISIIGVIAIIFYIAYRMRLIKKNHLIQNEISKYRQQSLIRQMDPHFVFNTLNSIQSFVIKNDNLSSTIYLSKFSRLMRIILNNSQKQEVALSDEIDSISLYLDLECMRFTRKFLYNISVEDGIDSDLIHIPAFIIQPFVENSIWHGIMNIDRQGVIKISFQMDGQVLLCTIEDNGVGRERAMELKRISKSRKKSYGISIVESRLSILSSFYGINLRMNYVDLYNKDNEPSGTKVIFNLPIVN